MKQKGEWMRGAGVKRSGAGMTVSAVVGALLLVTVVVVSPSARAADYGTFNYMHSYIYNGVDMIADVYVERGPRLIYNPNQPGDAYTWNGYDFYVNMWKFHSSTLCNSNNHNCVPSYAKLTVILDDRSKGFCTRYSCSHDGNQYWHINRFWPMSSAEYGTTVSWSYTVTATGDILSGGISGSVTGSAVNSIDYNLNNVNRANLFTQVGWIQWDWAQQFGWNQATMSGGFRITIKNSDGPSVNNNQFLVWVEYQLNWARCDDAGYCSGETPLYGTVYMGGNYGTGDGYIYVRTGTSSGT